MGAAGKGLGIIGAVLALIIAILPASALAGENGMQTSFDVAVGATYLSGNTDYQIGGKVVWDNFPLEYVHFPVSELDWPLDSVWANDEVIPGSGRPTDEKGRVVISASYRINEARTPLMLVIKPVILPGYRLTTADRFELLDYESPWEGMSLQFGFAPDSLTATPQP